MTGYLISFFWFVDFTKSIASTTMSAKKPESAPMILLDIDVLAMLIKLSLPRASTFAVMFSFMYLTASLRANR